MIDIELAGRLFWWASLLLAYTWIGYPLVALMLERIFYRPVRREAQTPPLTVLMVVHNEEKHLAAKLENLLAQDYPAGLVRIVVASDGSTDRTAEIAHRYAARGVVFHAHAVRRGKAAVLNDEVPQCGTELVMLCDARQRLAPDVLSRLAAVFADPAVGAASGELVLEEAVGTGVGRGMGVYWRYEKFLRQKESAIHSSVGATGALLALRRHLWRGLPPNTILDDMVFPFQVVAQGYRVVLESDALVYDRPNETWEREFVRKTRTLAGNFQVLFHPFRFSAPLFGVLAVQYWSHKVLRLFGPLLLVVAFWGNYWLARAHPDATWRFLYETLLAGQGLFYLSCVMGFCAEHLQWRLPLVHVPYSFLVTQVAIVCGFLRFGSGRDSGIWEKSETADGAVRMQNRLFRLLLDSTLYCFGILVAFRIVSPPQHIFRLFSDLNPQL
mgnify:CR=1 FL=1